MMLPNPEHAESRRSSGGRTLTIVAAGVSIVLAGGCKKEPPPPPPRPAPVAAAPRVVEEVVEVELDPRVQFPDAVRPAGESLANAVGAFASAIASGDADGARAWMSESDQSVLDEMVQSGEWDAATSGIEIVRIASMNAGDETCSFGLAIQGERDAYLLAWDGTRSDDGEWRFSAKPIVPRFASVASDLDGAEFQSPVIPEAEFEVFAPASDEDEQKNTRRSGSSSRRSGGGGGRKGR